MADKEVIIRQVGNGGFVVLEKNRDQGYGASSNLAVSAAFTKYEDLVSGLSEVFGIKSDGVNVEYLTKRMDQGYQGPG